MAYKTNALLDSARQRQQLLEEAVTAELLRNGVEEEALEAQLAENERVEDARLLTTARSEQLEDWIAPIVFFVFFGGADAYVSAHLADFPVPLTVEPVAGPSGTAFEVAVSLPWTPGSWRPTAPRASARPRGSGQVAMPATCGRAQPAGPVVRPSTFRCAAVLKPR